MEHYVTLFDSLFLPQGMALHISMERHIKDYTLWILCVDDEAYDVLTKLQLANVRLLQLSTLETEELLRVKPTRSKGEYCWTLTPFAPRFVFEADATVHRVTYLDADLWFRKHPKPIFDEFEASGKHVLITDHAYAPEYDQSATSGQYCVQFMTFSRHAGEEVRKWWEERCIEWCYARHEDGKFGDQKYLDDWPDRFANSVHVLANKEYALAPWNATRFPYSAAIFYHFHGLRIFKKRKKYYVFNGTYFIPKPTYRYIYKLYLNDLQGSIFLFLKMGAILRNQKNMWFGYNFFTFLKVLYSKLFRLNVYASLCYVYLKPNLKAVNYNN
uniref:Putative glycosyltransferase n=1 Tax=Chlorobium chlorochromatii (strain CaD3) TaxID=340177 RepID=Q3ASS9_CHLCH